MKLLVVSSAPLISQNNKWNAYAPYVKELAIWEKYVDEIYFCCPIWENDRSLLISEIPFEINSVFEVKEFDITNFKNLIKTFFVLPKLLFTIYKAMQKADHIHLRCPGNMGLLGCIVQIFFPKKKKTAKYAGNWKPKAQQPFSYKFQKWILSNTFLTKNMQVLVYGEWKNQSENIKPFFTATYSEEEYREKNIEYRQQIVEFLFVGTLSEGKRPLYTVQLVENLHKKGINAHLQIFGEGQKRSELENYIRQNNLENLISLEGNQSKDTVTSAYQNSDFLILPSKSEGWPKVVAEAMFWGCVPVATDVSCVPNMLDNGNRGILLSLEIEKDTLQIENLLNDKERYKSTAEKAVSWSRQFTTEKFEGEIRKLLIED